MWGTVTLSLGFRGLHGISSDYPILSATAQGGRAALSSIDQIQERQSWIVM
jgi:hypothetical protein